MVALLVSACAIGERSSRAIECCLREDVAVRVIGANRLPDDATIARIRVRHEAALAGLFSRVLPHLGVLSHNEIPAQISIAALATLD